MAILKVSGFSDGPGKRVEQNGRDHPEFNVQVWWISTLGKQANIGATAWNF